MQTFIRVSITFCLFLSNIVFAETTYPISCNSVENVTLNGDNSLTRINGTGWDGGAAGDNLLQPNTDGYVEWIIPSGNRQLIAGMAGFNNQSNNSTIDYSEETQSDESKK